MNVSTPRPLITPKVHRVAIYPLFPCGESTDILVPAFAANDTNNAHATVFLDMENFDSAARGDERLRYSTIEGVLQGLWIYMYQGRRETDTVFHIEDGGHRLVVGLGKVYGEGGPILEVAGS